MGIDKTDYIEVSMLDTLSQFLSQDKLQALLQCYIKDSTRILEQLPDCLANNDAEQARRHVHSLKSTSANIGAAQLATLAAELEELARLEQLEELKLRTSELIELFELTSSSIKQLEVMHQQAS